MALVTWAKKELSRLKLQSNPKRLTLPQTSTSTKCLPLPLGSHETVFLPNSKVKIQEVVLDADLRCANCQNRVSRVISNVEDVESIMVHVLEKKVKVTLIRESISK